MCSVILLNINSVCSTVSHDITVYDFLWVFPARICTFVPWYRGHWAELRGRPARRCYVKRASAASQGVGWGIMFVLLLWGLLGSVEMPMFGKMV